MPGPQYAVYWGDGFADAPDAWEELERIERHRYVQVTGTVISCVGPTVEVYGADTFLGHYLDSTPLIRWVTRISDLSAGTVITRLTIANPIARTAYIDWQKTVFTRPTVRTEAVEDAAVRVRREAELAARQQARREERARQHKEAAELRKVAESRAAELLWRHLDQAQREDLLTKGMFKLVSKEGRRYAILKRRAGNVVELTGENDQEFATARFCLHSTEFAPIADDMLNALLLLRHHEAEYLRIANKTPLSTTPPLSAVVAEGNAIPNEVFQRIAREIGAWPDEPDDLASMELAAFRAAPLAAAESA